MDADSSRSDHAPIGLQTLPLELISSIVWDERLDLDDLKALRLTCRVLSTAVPDRLFYRIGISKLVQDRDAFLSICNSPHLAIHVRELEWLELSWHPRFSALIAGADPEEFDQVHGEDAQLYRDIDIAAEAVFWLPSVTPPPLRPLPSCSAGHTGVSDAPEYDQVEAILEKTATEFRSVFESAVDMLPNLHTFISRPMSPDRVITPLGPYPVSANLLQARKLTPGPSAETEGRFPRDANDGLFLFLLPAMSRPNSTIKRLRWADELDGYSFLRPIPASAFAGLEWLSLCLTYSKSISRDKLSGLQAACLNAAPTLQHFKLCLAHGNPHKSPSDLVPALATAPGCALHSLSLVAAGAPEHGLIAAIRANASSLRHIYFEGIPVKYSLLKLMREMSDLKLDSMRILDDTDDPLTDIYPDDFLVRYINGEEKSENGRIPNNGNGWAMREYGYDKFVRRIDDMTEQQLLDRRFFATGKSLDPQTASTDAQSDAGSDASADSFEERRRAAPKWAWGRYFHDARTAGRIYCFQVPDSHPQAHPTTIFKFTSRDGEVAYGVDPLNYFEDWDIEAGDREEPTPYCDDLFEFWRQGDELVPSVGDLREFLGSRSLAWETLKSLRPPEGAILFDSSLLVDYD
ncbi:hypothetical protein VTK26DRAFT_2196 [Humicola hyalothermophila]